LLPDLGDGSSCLYGAITSHFTYGGDKAFRNDELFVNTLERLNPTGETIVLDAWHLDGREAGFSSTL
jgi:hypothetical protein